MLCAVKRNHCLDRGVELVPVFGVLFEEPKRNASDTRLAVKANRMHGLYLLARIRCLGEAGPSASYANPVQDILEHDTQLPHDDVLMVSNAMAL